MIDEKQAKGGQVESVVGPPDADGNAERKKIPVYTIFVDEMRGPTEKTIASILSDIETECAEFAEHDGEPREIKVTMGFMFEDEYDALPEFEGY